MEKVVKIKNTTKSTREIINTTEMKILRRINNQTQDKLMNTIIIKIQNNPD